MDSRGRARLADEVWGPERAKRQLRRVARGGATGGGIGLLDACSGGDCGGCASGVTGEAFLAVVVIAAAVAIGALVAWGIYHLVRWILRKLDKPRPQGAFAKSPPLPAAKVVGRVRRLPGSALGAATPLAWNLVLRANKVLSGEKTMLVASDSPGFEVALSDGRAVRIPSGPLYLYGAHEEVNDLGEAEEVKDAILRASASASTDTDPESTGDSVPSDPIPFDRALRSQVVEGDLVEVYGDLEQVADAHQGSGYRTAASVLVPSGVPKIYRLGVRTPESTLQPPTVSPLVRVATNERTGTGASAYDTSADGSDGDATSLASK